MRKSCRLIIITVLIIMTFAAINCSFADKNVKYEMVRQGSVGESVQRVQIRLRELGYLKFKPTGSFRGMTVSATIEFQKMQTTVDGGWVAADGEAGEQTQSILFSARARRINIPANVHLPIGPSLRGEPKRRGTILSWDKIKSQLQVGKTYKIYDYNTGECFKVKYTGGKNHAEVECISAKETSVLLKVFGGEFNFSKRAVVFQLSTDKLVAASLFGQPHGTNTVNNNDMNGHICLFFDGSKSHVGSVIDVEHQKQIYVASGM